MLMEYRKNIACIFHAAFVTNTVADYEKGHIIAKYACVLNNKIPAIDRDGLCRRTEIFPTSVVNSFC